MQFFLLLEMLSLSLLSQLSLANIASLLVCTAIFILYSSYMMGAAPEKGFLIAFIFATASIFYARILYLLPVFAIGMQQMRASSWRTYAAMIIGLITPYWIILGMGWIDAEQIDFTALKIPLQLPTLSSGLIPAVLTIVLGMFSGIFNLLNISRENIQTRAFNGFITILSIYTALLMCIDHTHIETYLPVLNIAVAIQCTYNFTTIQNRLNTILFYSITILLIGLQVWMYWVI